MRRIYELDYIRVMAVLMILLCHYFIFSDLNSGVGRYLGGTGNNIFFFVSALLYGTIYGPTTAGTGGGKFMIVKKFAVGRIRKLGTSLWPFLFILVALYVIFGVDFSWRDVGLNFIFLGYLGKLPGNGHLWFLTVLMACYLEMVMLVKFGIAKQYRNASWLLLVLSVAFLIVGEYCGIPSGAFLILGLYGFVFINASWLIEKSKKMRWWVLTFIIAINLLTIYLEYNGLFETSRTTHFLLTGLCGFSLLVAMIRCFPTKSNSVITQLGTISFEIYLVHHTLCNGPFIMVTHWPFNHVANFFMMVGLSIFLAVLLHKIGMRLERYVR